MDLTGFPVDEGYETEIREPNRFFDSLVRNAMDFLKKSVDELEESPKYSVIYFSTAVELFLKARLLREHWSLIISNVNKVQKRKSETIIVRRL